MKRKMSKKVLCLCMVAVLAIGLAIPTFAAGISKGEGSYRLHPSTDPVNGVYANFCLNVEGNHQVSQNRNVGIYTPTGADDQLWIYEHDSDGEYRLKTAINTNYALNIYHPSTAADNHNCDIMIWSNNRKDSALVYYSGSTDFSHANGEIDLVNYNKVLAVNGLYNSSNVVWRKDGAIGSGYYMIWF